MWFALGEHNHRQAFASDTNLRVSAAGDALQQWQRRLSVNTDAAKGLEEEQARAAAEEQPAGTADDAEGGQYEFIAEGDAQQAGAQLWSLKVVSPRKMCGCLCQPLHATVTAVSRDQRSKDYDLPSQVTHKRWRQRQRSRRLAPQHRSRALRAAKGRRPRQRSPWRKRHRLQQMKRLLPRTRCSLLHPPASPHLRSTIAQFLSLVPTLMPFVGLVVFCISVGRVLRGMACISAEAGLLSQLPRADHVLTRGIGS